MILHDYACTNCNHAFEKFVAAEQKIARCPFCRCKAERVFLPSRKRHGNAQPTVYYMNKDGRKLYPWTGDALPKEYTKLGYQRCEVQPHEIRKFERQVNREIEAEGHEQSDRERERYEHERSLRHASLRDDARHMDDFGRAMVQEAINREDDGYSHRYDPEFHVGAYN